MFRLLKQTSLVLMLVACGQQEASSDRHKEQDPVDDIRQKLLALQGEIQSITESDYAQCDGALSAAAQNICKIAQAAMVESDVRTLNAISDLASQLESRVDDSGRDFGELAAVWKKVYGSDFPDATVTGTPTDTECQTNAPAANILACFNTYGTTIAGHTSDIATIESQISILNGTISGTMKSVEIGTENVLAGPIYEQVSRLTDESRINAYVDGLASPLGLPNNPLTATNGSGTVTITTSAVHGLSVGHKVRIEDCQSGRGLTWQHLNGTFEVLTTPLTTTFTILLSGSATSNGTLGGATCVIRKFSGAGMSTIWTNAAASDSAVRVTTGGSKSYNFMICKVTTQGKVCYDKTNRSALAATIIAGWATCAGSGNIVCK